MRILFAADLHPNSVSGAAGTEFFTIEGLRRLGHHVDAIWHDELPHRWRHGNLHYLFELPQGFRDAIRRRCAGQKYDVLHVNQPHAWMAAKDHRASRREGVFVNRSHGLETRCELVLQPWRRVYRVPKRSWQTAPVGMMVDYMLERSQRLVSRYADGHIVSCRDDDAFLQNRYGVPNDRIGMIHQAPYNLFLDRPLPRFAPDRMQKLLHVGQFAFFKGGHVVADVANQLLVEGANAQLTWVLSPLHEAQASQLLTVPARERTKFVTHVQEADRLIELFDDAGIFLFPSFFEGFGKAFLEGMTRGQCVITTRAGAMHDIIEDGENGFLNDLGDVDSMARQIQLLWNNPKLAEQVSRKAVETAREFNWNRVARESADFYERLLSMKTRKTRTVDDLAKILEQHPSN